MLIIIQAGISCKWTNDSQRFLLEHLDTINNSPSHIYHSALPFSPPSTWLQEYYGSELSQEVRVVKGLPAEWGICSRTVSLGSAIYEISCWNNTLAIGYGYQNIIILDATTGSQTAILLGHTGRVWSVSFLSDGRSLVSGSDDKTVKLWDMQTGGAIRTFSGHTELVCSVSISVDGVTIASGSFDKTIRLWNTQTGECCCIIEQPEKVYLVRFSPKNPQHFLSGADLKVWQWNTSGHQVGPTLDGNHFDLSPDGTQLISYCWGMATIQNPSSGAVKAEFQVIGPKAGYSHFSPDGKMVAIAVGSAICVWNITNSEPQLVGTFIGHADDISYLVFSSPSSIVSVSYDQSVKFWKIGDQSTALVGTDPSSATIMSITIQAKDNISITSDSKGVVKIWDILTGVCKASFQTPAEGADKRDVQMINGSLVLAWHTDEMIKIWDVEKDELLLTTDGPTHFEDIKISEDGSRVFSIGARVIQAQSMTTGEILGKAGIKFIDRDTASLTVNGSRVWVDYINAESQVWDFGAPDSPPVQLPNIPLYIHHPNGSMQWNTSLSCVEEKATGKVVFWLSKRYGKPVNVQWNSQYLVASFMSGEVLVLDFCNMFPL